MAPAPTAASLPPVLEIRPAETVSSDVDVVFVGSSTIAGWDVRRSFPDLRVLNRGVAGSLLADAIGDAVETVVAFRPRLVVMYAGENDIASDVTAADTAQQFQGFAGAVHAQLPSTGIVFLGMKPSIQRWHLVERMREANAMIRAICGSDERLTFVDVEPAMLDPRGYPRARLFDRDGLHLSPRGYRMWTRLLRPYLTAGGGEAPEASS